MSRGPSSATHGLVDVESDNALPFLTEEKHGGSHTACSRGETSSKEVSPRGTGASETHGSPLHAVKRKLSKHLIVIVLLLAISLCMQKPRGSLRKGMQRRRLAGGHERSGDAGDVRGPPSPDFSELCLELGAWSPSDPSPGGARYSPLLVDAFFTSLDQSIAQPPAQTSTPGAAPTPRELLLAQPEAGEKRPLDEEEFDNEAGTSGKVARTHAQAGAVQASSSQLVHFGSLEPEASSQPSPEQLTLADPLSFQPSSSSAVSHLMQTAPAHQPAEPASASSEVVFFLSVGPAAGLPPPQRPEADLGPRHPFVRLPRLKPGVKTRQFMTSAMRSANLAPRRHCDTLLRLRRLFRLSRLSEREAGSLVSCAEELAAHAYHSLQDKPQDTSPFFASIRLGRKFLIVYYLLRASQVLGQKWPSESWWGELMERIPHQYFFVWARDPRASAFSVSLANDLSHAISLMKSGVFPPPSVIIQLKRRLFCMSESPGKLKEKVWDPWRQDDEEAQTSRESLKPH